jgi:hypothetical protein
MPLTFKTKSYANILMMDNIAMKMLEMMGYGCSVPGAITIEDVPVALDNLKAKLALIPQQTNSAGEDDDNQAKVGLHTRAIPLLELLQAAVADKQLVRWE